MHMALRKDVDGFEKRLKELASAGQHEWRVRDLKTGKGTVKRVDGQGKGLYDQFKNKISKTPLGCG